MKKIVAAGGLIFNGRKRADAHIPPWKMGFT